MERELWSELMSALHDVSRSRTAGRRFTHDTSLIMRVYLWSVVHDRPVCWACCPGHWDRATRPAWLPSQSTMSRRLRTPLIKEFFQAMGRRLAGRRSVNLVKLIDGKPFSISRHSQDSDAQFGRGAGGKDKGYKLHAIWGDSPIPEAFEVTPMNVSEGVLAERLIPRLKNPAGYILADASYDSSGLHELASRHGCQLLAPRRRPETGLGHHFQSVHRLRAIEMLEGPSSFGRSLYRLRRLIESQFAGLTCFGGGLPCLPPWVRGLHRVRLYVHAKLLVNAARIRTIPKRRTA